MTAGRLLVVGASSGIGRATVAFAAERGWKVAAAARRAHLLEELAGETGAVPVVADVTEEERCRGLVEEAVDALGGLDALVYAAGIVPLRDLDASDAGLWHEVLATNVVGAALVTAAAHPHLVAASGRIVYLSSNSVDWPFPGLVPYAVSKAALETLGRGFASERPGMKVKVMKIGPTLTGMADGWDPDDAARHFERWYADSYLDEEEAPREAADVARDIVWDLEEEGPPSNVGIISTQP